MKIYEIIQEGKLPGDSSTLLSLLAEMIGLLGAGSPQQDSGDLRSAVMQTYNNGSADDGQGFSKQLNFRLGSIQARWTGLNWPQLKSCFLRLAKNHRYRHSISALDELGNWPVLLIKDPKSPSLSKYFTTILTASSGILQDMAKFDPEEHVRQRAAHLAKEIPQRLRDFNTFKNYWISQYDKETSPQAVNKPKTKNALPGQQAAVGQSIVDQVLSAIPPALSKELRPQVQRMGDQNEKLMFLMKALQKAGIDPNKVLG